MAVSSLTIKQHFRKLRDPRRRHRRLHHLMDIITIAICAVIAGASNWKQIEAFGRQRERWLRRFLALANGIPAHDTFQRVFARLDPVAFQVCFRDWLINLADAVDIKQIPAR
ncbi:MAG: hypothetical protein KatS3mg105_2030 [Gemmatales bacterium]|nr:MAG: hypothetical protein KatS3mg105_2030 [Gemmatales bacterium]